MYQYVVVFGCCFSPRVPCGQTPFIVLIIGDLGSRTFTSHLTNKHVFIYWLLIKLQKQFMQSHTSHLTIDL